MRPVVTSVTQWVQTSARVSCDRDRRIQKEKLVRYEISMEFIAVRYQTVNRSTARGSGTAALQYKDHIPYSYSVHDTQLYLMCYAFTLIPKPRLPGRKRSTHSVSGFQNLCRRFKTHPNNLCFATEQADELVRIQGFGTARTPHAAPQGHSVFHCPLL